MVVPLRLVTASDKRRMAPSHPREDVRQTPAVRLLSYAELQILLHSTFYAIVTLRVGAALVKDTAPGLPSKTVEGSMSLPPIGGQHPRVNGVAICKTVHARRVRPTDPLATRAPATVLDRTRSSAASTSSRPASGPRCRTR